MLPVGCLGTVFLLCYHIVLLEENQTYLEIYGIVHTIYTISFVHTVQTHLCNN